MPRVGFVTGEPIIKLNQELLDSIQKRARQAKLRQTYNTTSSWCSVCGVHISTEYGEPLGRYFVMDTQGRFYCMNCDKHFGEGDEEIYVLEEDM